jgi:hypothetical protein
VEKVTARGKGDRGKGDGVEKVTEGINFNPSVTFPHLSTHQLAAVPMRRRNTRQATRSSKPTGNICNLWILVCLNLSIGAQGGYIFQLTYKSGKA